MVTQVEELGENRVRLTVDVPAHDVAHAVEHAASDLATQVKIPGFRKGKVPMPVLVSRVGKERIYAEAVDSHIGGWFWRAAAQERIRPVAEPQYEYELPADDSAGWSFSATVDIQPKPEIPDWTTLEVPKAAPEVPAELIDRELDALRESVAELVPADGRPAREGDTLVIDLVSPSGEAQRDYVVELGTGRLVEEVEVALVGASAGETKHVDYGLADEAAAAVEITIKEIKEKVLPPLDDELARAASEFDTLADLRADIEARLREQLEAEVEGAFRAAAVDTLVAESNVQAAGPLVESRTSELLSGFLRSLQRRGITPETYLMLTGRSPQELQESMRAEAAQSVSRELVLEALADRLGIEVADEQVLELIREQAEEGEEPADVLEQLRHSGRLETLREDLRLRDALDRLVADVRPIAVALAEAREKLWTPDKEKTPSEQKLWTPGSKKE